tara:strand:- start:111 stop:452 length:342 start_codon:yes stop_codon:yes gene_type:complete
MYKTRILVDENLSRKLSLLLKDDFAEIEHISSKGLLSEADLRIWEYAKKNSFSILTKDSDFKNLSTTYGCPPKVIRMNCGNKTTLFISELLKSKKKIIKEFLADGMDCYLEII